ncbi:hypothetical protein ENSA5_33610 [Enhygromyxa salina]|uniref:Phytanoyl-CoA dioxygenase (PhyH) n=1 Tax=Enhygromyxa salina TaxID=215803 RepID=A0A2S9XX71_9BACT|nr:hypothetical protein [Enhygromyxa salina]PRP97468.1 hypothetical protein ENSA5_33610 [Enhygromyxa salina]
MSEEVQPSLQPSQLEALSRQLVERSFAVLPGHYGPAKVGRIRAALERIYHRLDDPPLWSNEPRWLNDDLEVSGTGVVIHKLLSFDPELHRDILEPDVIEIIRGALGPDMHLEFAGAVVTNYTRPFFKWHNHVGGIDDERYRRLGLRPAIEKPERVAMIVYLDEMGPETGQLLIHPERVSGAAGPPEPVDKLRWDGQFEVVGPPGTVVMIDQTTWHAALPRTIDHELRFFFGLWFAASCVAKTERVDESLFEIDSPDPLLQSLLPRPGDA